MIRAVIRIYRKIIALLQSAQSYAASQGVRFGKRCRIYTKRLGSEPYLIRMGDDVTVSEGVSFITHDGAVHVLRTLNKDYADKDIFGPITIGNNVFIGAGSIILPGVRIGDNVIIGAGSIVNRNCDSNSVYAGVPARCIRSIDEYAEKNLPDAIATKQMQPDEKRKYLIDFYQLS